MDENTLDTATGKAILDKIVRDNFCTINDLINAVELIDRSIPEVTVVTWINTFQAIGLVEYLGFDEGDDDVDPESEGYYLSENFNKTSTPKLKQFCDRMGIATEGKRSKKITFVEAIQAYLDQPIEQPIQEIADRNLCIEDYETALLVILQAIVIVAIVSFKTGWYLGDLIATCILPKILKWKNAQDWDQMKQRLLKQAREIDPTI
jgi:hypothetical protein